MGKQESKRIDLAKRVLETTDKATLEAVEIALLGVPPVSFSSKELAEMEVEADRIEKGLDRTYSWAEVKRSAMRKSRK